MESEKKQIGGERTKNMNNQRKVFTVKHWASNKMCNYIPEAQGKSSQNATLAIWSILN